MSKEELTKKLETVKLPAIELPGHRSRLRMAVLDAYHHQNLEKLPVRYRLKGEFMNVIRGLFSHWPSWESALAALIVIVIIGLAVGLPLALRGEKTVSAEQIAANTILAASKVSTVKIEMNMTGTMEIVGGPHAGILTTSAQSSSIEDFTNKKQLTTMDMTINMPVIGEQQQISQQIYMVEGWMYLKMTLPGGSEQWTKVKMPALFSASDSELSKENDLLKTAQKVSLVGTEKVDGIDCYVLQVDVDMQKVKDWMLSQKGLLSGLDLGALNSQFYKSYTFKEWISEDGFLPMKTVKDVVIEVLPSNSGNADNEFERATYTIHAEGRFYDHNQSVTIELPPTAQDAKELPIGQ